MIAYVIDLKLKIDINFFLSMLELLIYRYMIIYTWLGWSRHYTIEAGVGVQTRLPTYS